MNHSALPVALITLSVIASVLQLIYGAGSDGDPRTTHGAALRAVEGYLRWDDTDPSRKANPIPIPEGGLGQAGAPHDCRIELHVTDVRGDPAAGAGVAIVAQTLHAGTAPRIALCDARMARTDDAGRARAVVPLGSYTISVAGSMCGEEWSAPLTVGDADREVRVDAVLGSAVPITVKPTGDAAAAVQTIRVVGAHFSMAWDVAVGQRLAAPAQRDAVVLALDGANRCLGLARASPGSGVVSVECIDPVRPREPGDQSWTTVLVEPRSPACTVLGTVDGIQDLGRRADCVALSDDAQPFVVGRSRHPKGTLRRAFVRCELESDEPGAGLPWCRADVRSDAVLEIGERRVRVGVDRVWSDDIGLCEVRMAKDAGPPVVEHPRVGVIQLDAISEGWRVRGAPAETDAWVFAQSRAPVSMIVPNVGRVVRQTDGFGILRSPARRGTSVIVTHVGEEIVGIEHLALDRGLAPWKAYEPPERGRCRIVHGGGSEAPKTVSVLGRGFSGQGHQVPVTDHGSKWPTLGAGSYVLAAQTIDPSAMALQSFDLLGRAGQQVIRYALPAGGMDFGKFGADSEILLFESAGTVSELIWRSGDRGELRRLYLRAGRYLVQVQSGHNIAFRDYVEVAETGVAVVEPEPMPSFLIEARMRVAGSALAPNAPIEFRSSERDVAVEIRTNYRGVARIAWPMGAFRARSRYASNAGPSVASAGAAQAGQVVEIEVPLQEGS